MNGVHVVKHTHIYIPTPTRAYLDIHFTQTYTSMHTHTHNTCISGHSLHTNIHKHAHTHTHTHTHTHNFHTHVDYILYVPGIESLQPVHGLLWMLSVLDVKSLFKLIWSHIDVIHSFQNIFEIYTLLISNDWRTSYFCNLLVYDYFEEVSLLLR